MNEDIGWKKYYPEDYTTYSMPIMILGVVIIVGTNFFRKKKQKDKDNNSKSNKEK